MRVKFWPKANGIPVEVCNHRHGAAISVTQATDSRNATSLYAGELIGFKNNLRLGCTASSVLNQPMGDCAAMNETGIVMHDIYLKVDWMVNLAGDIVAIPDYSSATWTAAGAAVFSGATEGAAKSKSYPNHGQQMYDISGGVYGYDLTTDTIGSNNLAELIGLIQHELDWLKSYTGYDTPAASATFGQMSGAIPLIPQLMDYRNSAPIRAMISGTTPDAETFYGYDKDGNALGIAILGAEEMSRERWMSFYSSTLYWNSFSGYGGTTYNTQAQANSYVFDQLNKTLGNGGWFRDFTHWHQAFADGTFSTVDDLLALIRSTVGSTFIHSGSYGEILAYMWYRHLSKRVHAYEKDGDVIIINDLTDELKGTTTNGLSNAVIFSQLFVPLSIKIDLSGTSLAGKNVKSNYGKLRSLGSDVYIVEMRPPTKEMIMAVTLSEGTGGLYDETTPTGSFSLSGNTITVTTNIPTKAVLFGVSASGSEYDSKNYGRDNVLATSHKFTVSDITMDYRIGIITEFGQATLITS